MAQFESTAKHAVALARRRWLERRRHVTAAASERDAALEKQRRWAAIGRIASNWNTHG